MVCNCVGLKVLLHSYLFVVAIVHRSQVLIQAQKSLQFNFFAFGLSALEPFNSDAPRVDIDTGNHS